MFSSLKLIKANQVIVYFLALVFALMFIVPFVVVFLCSFKTDGEIFTSMTALPHQLLISNYIEGWKIAKFQIAIKNSLIVTGGVVSLTVLTASFAAYAFAKLRFHARDIVFFIFIGSMMIPFQVIMIPLSTILARMKLINSLVGLILPQVALGLPLATFILTGFFREIPDGIIDAARIDGCSNFRILTTIVLFLAKPALSTVIALQFLQVWNNFLVPVVIVRGEDLRTIPLALQAFTTQYYSIWGLQFAMINVSMIPIILIYIILHRQFIQGLHVGAMKG